MPRIRPLQGREAGIAARIVQFVFRRVPGRELDPYKVEAHAPRTLGRDVVASPIVPPG